MRTRRTRHIAPSLKPQGLAVACCICINHQSDVPAVFGYICISHQSDVPTASVATTDSPKETSQAIFLPSRSRFAISSIAETSPI
ncbi:hypothetical protein [Helicobacter felis]|uniref:hypothetical protein n=1 Tax=Helicobacter felis TaxID=214 RepID=UPI001315283B|nr:hypothetical protein [Helicobacter felis]